MWQPINAKNNDCFSERGVELIEVSTPGGKAGIGAVASHIDDK